MRLGEHELRATAGAAEVRGAVKLVIRSEQVVVGRAAAISGANCLPGVIERLVFQGPVTQVHVLLVGGVPLQALVPNQGRTTRCLRGPM